MTEEADVLRPSVKVVVFADTDPDLPEISYHLQPAPGHAGKHKGDKLWFPKDKMNPKLEFKLHDNTGLNLKFKGAASSGKGSPAEAVWIAEGESCPAGAGTAGSAFTLNSVEDLLLKFDDNGVKDDVTYCYRLNFTSDQGDKCWDPIIKNGGAWP